MSPQILIFWILNIITDTAGQLAFKAGADDENHHVGLRYFLQILRNKCVIMGIFCYAFEFFLWLGFLSLVPLSDGVLLGSFNIVVILFAGRYFFNEKMTKLKIMGIILITLGVTLVGYNI